MKEKDFNAVQHLLPDSVKELVKTIGLANAFLLVKQLGGTRFPVSKNINKWGVIRYEALAEVIGVDAADIITRHYGGFELYIPRCLTALTEARNRLIRAYFDRESKNLSGQVVVTDLALQYRLSYRQIENILGETNKEDAQATQECLF